MTVPGATEVTASAATARPAIDRTASAERGGSVIFVLLVAGVLVGAATGIVVLGRSNAEPYILGFLAVLATLGVFSLFAVASGILRLPAAEAASPLIKRLVDEGFDATLVTDADGRVLYANAAYLDLIGAADANDIRPVERVFIGDADVSEAIYRLLKAAREGKRLQEEVRVAGIKGRPARWLRLRVWPLGEGKRASRLTVWSLSDVTRERERQENVFQELQHAIDYLDHAPAGFFFRRCERRCRLPECDARQLAGSGPRPGRLRRPQTCGSRRRRWRGAADDAACSARRDQD